MQPDTAPDAAGVYTFRAAISPRTSGDRGFSVRVMPNNENLASPFALGLMTWPE
jgi:hypothetical protein